MANSKRVLYLDDTKDYRQIYSFLKERYAWSIDATRYKEFLERVSTLEEGTSIEFQWSNSLKSQLGFTNSSIQDGVVLRISSVKVKEGVYRPDSKHYYILANLVLPLSSYPNLEVDLGYIYFTGNVDTKDNTLTLGAVDYATSYVGFERGIISEVAFYGEGVRVDEAVLGFFVE